MKRSRQIRLALSGAVASTLWTTGCQPNGSELNGPSNPPTIVSTNQAYTNNHYLSNSGYYHAPYGGWYARPFNSYLPGRGYYYGGNWWPSPHRGSVLVSTPRPAAVETANLRTETLRARAGGVSSSGENPAGSGRGTWSSGRSGNSSSGVARGGFGGSHSSTSS